jgi:hypothetical protein
MLACNFSGLSLLWFLLCLYKSNGSSSESSPGEEGNYVHGGESELLSPGKDIPECSMLLHCCEYEECQCDDFLPDDFLQCGSKGGLSISLKYLLPNSG